MVIRRVLFAVLTVLACAWAIPALAATTLTVTGTMQTPAGIAQRNSFARFELVYCGGNTGVIVSTATLVTFVPFDVNTISTGVFSTPLYGNNEIKCGITTGSSRWRVTRYSNGVAGPSYTYQLTAPGTVNLDGLPACSGIITTNCVSDLRPVVPPPPPIVGPPGPTGPQGPPGAGNGDAGSIQGNLVSAGTANAAGQSYVWDGTHFILQSAIDVDSRSCLLPTDGTTDAFPALKSCVNNHPGAHIKLWKTASTSGCDYMLSDSIFLLGQGMWIDGGASGTGNGFNGVSIVTVCTSSKGVTPFITIGASSAGSRLSNFGITGLEPWTRTDASTFKYPFGFGYPGIPWVTATTTASSATVTVNGTNEAWTSQTDGQTVRINGAGAVQGTITVSTTANNYTVTCACTKSMIGQTIAIPTALGGATLYAHIVALTGNTGYSTFTTGNAQVDNVPTSTVSSQTGTLSYDYYGTVSSHASASSATVTPVVTTAVSNSVITVGSEADGIRSGNVGSRIDHMTIRNMGRHGINVSNTFYPTGTGSASMLSDEVQVDSNLILLNRGDGIFCQGADCNVNKYSLSTINQNQFWSIDDAGFLINTIDTVNSAGNHVDCTQTPCPAIGGSTGKVNATGTWYGRVTAPPILVTDGTCTDSSTTITTTSSGKFVTGQADATNGQIIKLHNCGAAGAADITTFITGFTTANSITVADAPTCGGSCPGGGAATLQVYPTVTTVSGSAFDPTYVGHSVMVATAGPAGQALVTTMAVYYSTTKMGLNAAPTNGSSPQAKSLFFGAIDYQQELNWQKAWDFSTGAITSGASVLTLTAANELFIAAMCNAATNLRQVITVVGAGVGGGDLSATCLTFTNTHQVTLSTPASATVSNAEVRIEQDGGPYAMRGGSCLNCYEEIDQYLHTSKFGAAVLSTPSIRNVPATSGTNTYTPIFGPTNVFGATTFHNFTDGGMTINLAGGRSAQQQVDINWISVADYTTKMAQISMTAGNIWNFLVGTKTALSFAPNVVRDYRADTSITSGLAHRFQGNATSQQLFAINADGSLLFSCNSSSTNCGKFTATNTGSRVYTFPDTTGTIALTSDLPATSPTYNAAGTLQTSAHIVSDSSTLTSGTPSTKTITLAGSAVYTSNATYNCTVTNKTTPGNGLSIAYTNGTTFVVTGPNTVTDGFSFVCSGK